VVDRREGSQDGDRVSGRKRVRVGQEDEGRFGRRDAEVRVGRVSLRGRRREDANWLGHRRRVAGEVLHEDELADLGDKCGQALVELRGRAVRDDHGCDVAHTSSR
jgi:hypothetical protein